MSRKNNLKKRKALVDFQKRREAEMEQKRIAKAARKEDKMDDVKTKATGRKKVVVDETTGKKMTLKQKRRLENELRRLAGKGIIIRKKKREASSEGQEDDEEMNVEEEEQAQE